jgi:hypothetical protein
MFVCVNINIILEMDTRVLYGGEKKLNVCKSGMFF